MNIRIGKSEHSRLDVAKYCLKQVIESLQDSDLITVLAFNTSVTEIYAGKVGKFSEEYIEDIFADRETDFGSCLKAVAKISLPNQQLKRLVIFITDGLPNVGISDASILKDLVTQIVNNASCIFSVIGVSDDADMGMLNTMAKGAFNMGIVHHATNDTLTRSFAGEVANVLTILDLLVVYSISNDPATKHVALYRTASILPVNTTAPPKCITVDSLTIPVRVIENFSIPVLFAISKLTYQDLGFEQDEETLPAPPVLARGFSPNDNVVPTMLGLGKRDQVDEANQELKIEKGLEQIEYLKQVIVEHVALEDVDDEILGEIGLRLLKEAIQNLNFLQENIQFTLLPPPPQLLRNLSSNNNTCRQVSEQAAEMSQSTFHR